VANETLIPCYYALDCIQAADGRLVVIDMHGGVGGGLTMMAAGYGGQSAARARLEPYLRRLGELAGGRLVLFVQDLFTAGQAFPDDFFNLVQKYIGYCPVTDWVPDLQASRRQNRDTSLAPEVEQMGVLLDPLANRLRLKIAYCAGARLEEQRGKAKILLSGYRERARHRPTTVITPPEEIGVVVFSGPSERFPDDFRKQPWFTIINPPVVDQLLENRWLLGALLEGTPAARLLPRSIPVGMGLRTSHEVTEFAASLQAPGGFPLAVLKPSHLNLSLGVRFLDRVALRALAVRQPDTRLPGSVALELVNPRIAHSYEEIMGYRGKQLDNLLRTPGAEVHDHGDGAFHYTAPYPFLENTVALLQEFVEPQPIRARRTGKLHRGYLRVVIFDRRIMAALHRLDQEPDDGTFRDITRPDVPTFFEGVSPEMEAQLQAQLGPFIEEMERQLQGRIHTSDDVARLRERWLMEQILPSHESA